MRALPWRGPSSAPAGHCMHRPAVRPRRDHAVPAVGTAGTYLPSDLRSSVMRNLTSSSDLPVLGPCQYEVIDRVLASGLPASDQY